jgi:hypothetical protein
VSETDVPQDLPGRRRRDARMFVAKRAAGISLDRRGIRWYVLHGVIFGFERPTFLCILPTAEMAFYWLEGNHLRRPMASSIQR